MYYHNNKTNYYDLGANKTSFNLVIVHLYFGRNLDILGYDN